MQKRFSGGIREWLMIAVCALLLLGAMFWPLQMAVSESLNVEEAALLEAWEKGELIRLHILAASDSPADQALKIKVRDALIETFGAMLTQEGQTSHDIEHLLLAQLPCLRQTAEECARKNGFAGGVHAEYGLLELPEKQYGSIVLPAGRYRGLRITLGEGSGKNWWCVLYPQLCLALSEDASKAQTGIFVSSERILRCWLMVN